MDMATNQFVQSGSLMNKVYKSTDLPTSSETTSKANLGTSKTWTDIVTEVNSNNGVSVVSMETLRDVDGYGRLGSTVRANIARKLASVGLGYLCGTELPNDSSACVILYRLGTPTANLIEAVSSAVAGGKACEETAFELRKLNIMPDPQALRDGIMVVLEALDNPSN